MSLCAGDWRIGKYRRFNDLQSYKLGRGKGGKEKCGRHEGWGCTHVNDARESPKYLWRKRSGSSPCIAVESNNNGYRKQKHSLGEKRCMNN